MEVLIGASNAFIKWMKLDLPRIPSIDGKRIGTQPITSTASSVAWQCHALLEHSRATIATIIAVEARSRFCIIFSNMTQLSIAEFEQQLKNQWLREVLFMAHASGAVDDNEKELEQIGQQFIATKMDFNWVKNTDLSVSVHVSDVEQWIRSTSSLNRANHLGPQETNELAYHINTQRKKAKQPPHKKMASFIPVSRLLDDGLFRFANGLSNDHYPETALGNFPSPYPQQNSQPQVSLIKSKETLPANVVCLDKFRQSRG